MGCEARDEALPVVDRRTYGKARLRLHELITADRWGRAWTQTVSICHWLEQQVRYGRKRRRPRYAADLERYGLLRAECRAIVFGHDGEGWTP